MNGLNFNHSLPIVLLFFVGCLSQDYSEYVEESDLKPEAISLLGEELFPNQSTEVRIRLEKNREEAFEKFSSNPDNLENIIWLGRRTAYLMRYREAIMIFENGLKKHPDSYKLLRHSGHRKISIRHFSEAIDDLKRAASLVEGKQLEIEPDGIPNKLNTPLSNTQFNIWYHLGLAYYLDGDYDQAVEAYKRCMEFSINNDLLIATSDWLYMTYLKLGQTDNARKVLDPITEKMEVIENDSYLQRLLMYKGVVAPEDLLDKERILNKDDMDLVIATQGYGVGNWYLAEGDTAKALEIFHDVVNGKSWSSFGYIAAEVELKNLQ